MEKTAARLRGLYRYRALMKQLVIKDLKLKYRRSFLGYVWSVLNPLMVMVVMYLVFSQMFRFEVENYPAYLIIGQATFHFMTEATDQAVFSITGNSELLKKVYVPKYVFTLSKVTSSLVNLLFSLAAMFLVFICSGVRFSLYMLLIPLVLSQLYVFSLGLGLFLAQAAVFFRDIQYIYSVLTTAWMYATPLFYPVDLLSDQMRRIVQICNPMYHYVTQFRTLVLERTLPQAGSFVYGSVLAGLFLLLGVWSFLKTQDRFILYI
ncbi:MAG: ABC transporter permease [Eubacterium sp.]|nr:ABC transporter permease [Eubacterium sp.]